LKHIQLDRSRCFIFSSQNAGRAFKVAVAGLAILATTWFPAAGQRGGGGGGRQLSPQQIELRDELKQGLDAYKIGHIDEAILHFRKATGLDPENLTAKVYLGTALAQTIAPGVDTPENLKIAQQAIDLFQEVLDKVPYDVKSMKQIAGIEFSIKKLDDAKAWQKKVLAADPKDAEAAYVVGVIDGMEAHQNAHAALQRAGIKDDGEGNAKAPAKAMEAIKAQNGALVEEALQSLSQAVENRLNYADAMANLGLVYRRKADLDWGDEAARKDDVAKAMEWRAKAINARKAILEKQSAEPDSAKP
jgi:tetratricopeptide (TPR) repeat protein